MTNTYERNFSVQELIKRSRLNEVLTDNENLVRIMNRWMSEEGRQEKIIEKLEKVLSLFPEEIKFLDIREKFLDIFIDFLESESKIRNFESGEEFHLHVFNALEWLVDTLSGFEPESDDDYEKMFNISVAYLIHDYNAIARSPHHKLFSRFPNVSRNLIVQIAMFYNSSKGNFTEEKFKRRFEDSEDSEDLKKLLEKLGGFEKLKNILKEKEEEKGFAHVSEGDLSKLLSPHLSEDQIKKIHEITHSTDYTEENKYVKISNGVHFQEETKNDLINLAKEEGEEGFLNEVVGLFGDDQNSFQFGRVLDAEFLGKYIEYLESAKNENKDISFKKIDEEFSLMVFDLLQWVEKGHSKMWSEQSACDEEKDVAIKIPLAFILIPLVWHAKYGFSNFSKTLQDQIIEKLKSIKIEIEKRQSENAQDPS